MLEYDNSAFYYFGITMLVIYVLPATYYSIKRVLFGLIFTDHLLDKHNVRCEKELLKIRQLQAEKTKPKNIFTWGFLLNLVVLALAWYILVQLVLLVKDDYQIKTFDPFEILNIESGASDREIKRAYRKMSLLYHPDKNPGDSVAEQKFMLIAKAYEALTNELAKANYEKYGNPDGRQALQLSIGLPTFLLNSRNHSIVIFIYLLVFVVIIPCLVALYYSKSQKYGDSMIMYDSYGFYNFALSEHTHSKMMPEILAGSAEFREIPLKESDNDSLQALTRRFKQDNMMAKSRYNHPYILKANLLIHAHLHREEITPSLENDLNRILKYSMHLIDGMIEICTMKCWLQTTINVIEFSQNLTQALWFKSSSLLQLPNFSETEVKHCGTGRTAVKTIEQYIQTEPENRKGMNKFTDEEKEEVNRVCGILPSIDYEVSVGVDDEEFIAEGDIMTVTVKITRKNVSEGETCDLVYAPSFPFPKAEKWYALVGDVKSNTLHAFSKITSQDRVVEEKLMLQAPPKAGNYQLDFFLKSDSYMGLDQKSALKFTVRSADELPEYEPHPEDLELDNDPTLFDQVMSGGYEDSSDSEDEESTFEDESAGSDGVALTDSQKRRRQERLRRRKNKDDSDEDEDENDDGDDSAQDDDDDKKEK